MDHQLYRCHWASQRSVDCININNIILFVHPLKGRQTKTKLRKPVISNVK